MLDFFLRTLRENNISISQKTVGRFDNTAAIPSFVENWGINVSEIVSGR